VDERAEPEVSAAGAPAAVVDQGPPWRNRWPRVLFPAVFLLYLAQTASGVARNTDGWASIAGYVMLAAFAACYLLSLDDWDGPIGSRAPNARTPTARNWAMWGAMIVLTLLVAPLAHEDVWVMYVFLSAIAIGTLGSRGLFVAAGFTGLAVFLPLAIPPWHAGVQADAAVSIPLISLALYTFFAVINANLELSEARGEIARLATESERSRIARDLHDLLGHSLTTITVKAGLARRLAEHDPAAAAREIAEVETIARSALSDVRAAVSGYREVTLAAELATGREVLRAAGIDAQLPGAVDAVDPANRELFGWVVREALTNVIRHSGASRCTIVLGPASVEIVDDGTGGATAPGGGLTGLRERVTAAGGTLDAGPHTPSGWRLAVSMEPTPAREPLPSAAST
jgi:two-component system sensor histidine kinase DesK